MITNINKRYRKIYLKNLIKYFINPFKKVNIEHLEVWVGTRCPLKCKNCNHLIPYIKQELFDIQEVINDLKTLLKYANIRFTGIMGGDPLTHPKVYELIDYVEQEPRLKKGKLVTNGFIIPTKPVLEALKNSKKIELHLDIYPGFDENIEKFKTVMNENKIVFTEANNYKTKNQWQFSGDVNQTELSVDETKYIFENCSLRRCSTFSNGEFVMCPRGIVSERIFGVSKNKFENVNLRADAPAFIKKALLECCLSYKEYKEYCKFCLGVDFSKQKKNIKYIQCGEQLTKDELAKLELK